MNPVDASYALDDTIAAVASAPGRSPRGLLRLAGPDTRAVLAHLLIQAPHPPTHAAAEKPPHEPAGTPPHAPTLSPPHAAAERSEAAGPPTPPNRPPSSLAPSPSPSTLTPARLRVPPLPVLCAVFDAGRSFTGQDAAELQLPGNPALLNRLLARCVAAGARPAGPGEFTFRAFAAGRIDLTRAEGVAATIAAESDGQLRAAARLRGGRLGDLAQRLVDRLGSLLALTEAGIDFVDQEDVTPISPAELHDGVRAAAAELNDLLARSRPWAEATALPRVVLTGPPSSGKSTLFNALLNRPRAVIDTAPGTTRDALAEPVTLPNANGPAIEAMLVDVAGLDEPSAALDRAIQSAARREIERADALIRLTPPDAGAADSSTPPETGQAVEKAVVIEVASKADVSGPHAAGALPVSAATGRGIDALRQRLAEALRGGAGVAGADALALQPRHERALSEALGELEAAAALLAPQRDERGIGAVELVAGHLRAALDALAGLGGRLTPDEVIGRVFATFCVGK